MKYQLTITNGDDRHLDLAGDSVNELVEKIKEWQAWEGWKDTMEGFGWSPQRIAAEKECGFYYFENATSTRPEKCPTCGAETCGHTQR